MPHLSPMSWLLLPILFMFIIMSLYSSMWWHHSAALPFMTSFNKLKTIFPHWKW